MQDSSIKNLCKLVNAPAFIQPWLDRFYEPAEITLLEKLSSQPSLPATDEVQFQNTFNLSPKTCQRLLLRSVLSNDGGIIKIADFHDRYDIWALFEGFKDLPDDIRNRLNQWELDAYIQSNEKEVEQIRNTGQLDPSKVIPRYLLLEQTFDVIDQAENIYLWPCNCRSMIQACKKNRYTCLRFSNSQGQGYEISREKAKQIVKDANRKGLIQSGELGWDEQGKLQGAICNCCTDCCFPHLLADRLKAEKIWPKSLAKAVWSKSKCSYCGLCAKRCPFQAFEYDAKSKDKTQRIHFYADRCRGCGLCAVTCPEACIEMKQIHPFQLNNRRSNKIKTAKTREGL